MIKYSIPIALIVLIGYSCKTSNATMTTNYPTMTTGIKNNIRSAFLKLDTKYFFTDNNIIVIMLNFIN